MCHTVSETIKERHLSGMRNAPQPPRNIDTSGKTRPGHTRQHVATPSPAGASAVPPAINFHDTDGTRTLPPSSVPGAAISHARFNQQVIWDASGRNLDCLLSSVAMTITATYADSPSTIRATSKLRELMRCAATTVVNLCNELDMRYNNDVSSVSILNHIGVSLNDLNELGYGGISGRELDVNFKLLKYIIPSVHMDLIGFWQVNESGAAVRATPAPSRPMAQHAIFNDGAHFLLLADPNLMFACDGFLPQPHDLRRTMTASLSRVATSARAASVISIPDSPPQAPPAPAASPLPSPPPVQRNGSPSAATLTAMRPLSPAETTVQTHASGTASAAPATDARPHSAAVGPTATHGRPPMASAPARGRSSSVNDSQGATTQPSNARPARTRTPSARAEEASNA